MEKCNSSMQLTRAADYGVRVMIYLAGLPHQDRVLLPTLAEATETPESFLSKVLQALCRAGLVDSRRGQAGGFVLSELGKQASVHAVVEAIDGPMHLNVCLVEGRSCSRKNWCPAHPVWVRAQRAMFDVLDQALIADIVEDNSYVQIQSSTEIPRFSRRKLASL